MPNAAPSLALPIANARIPEDSLWTFQVPPGTFIDADSAVLSYAASLATGAALPTWIKFDAATRTFSGTPPQDYTGVLSLMVTAGDGEFSASDTFTLTVAPVNDAPVLAKAIADQGVLVNQPWVFKLPAGSFRDVDSAALTYTAWLADGKPLPDWLRFDAATQTFSGTPP